MGATLLLVAASTFGVGERVTAIDLREDASSDGHFIIFCARYERVNSLRGDAYVLLGRGEDYRDLEYDRRYGLHQLPGRLALGEMTDEQVAASRAAQADGNTPPPTALVVQIDATQYAALTAVIDEWLAKESFDYPINTELAHFSEQLFKHIDLFPPYRAAFRGFNPIEYYADLRQLNQNRGRPIDEPPAV